MTESQKNALVKKALRNSRKAWRNLDTQGEKLERRLDRLIDRKTAPYGKEWDPMIAEWTQFKALIGNLEKSLADTITAGNI